MTRTGPRLVFVHGWGLEPTLWQQLRAELAEFDCFDIDLGFYGPPIGPAIPPDRPVVAVGHSLGVLWLLKTQPFPWSGLVSINGFPRFVEAANYQPAVPLRQIDRMIRRLLADPAGVVCEFRRRCGCTRPLPDSPLPESLRRGLIWLRDWDARPTCDFAPPAAPILALSGGADPILPVGMDEHCFRDFPQLQTERLDSGGHLLPLTSPDWCARHIRSFLTRIPAQ